MFSKFKTGVKEDESKWKYWWIRRDEKLAEKKKRK